MPVFDPRGGLPAEEISLIATAIRETVVTAGGSVTSFFSRQADDACGPARRTPTQLAMPEARR